MLGADGLVFGEEDAPAKTEPTEIEEESASLSLDDADMLEADKLFGAEETPEPEVAALSDAEGDDMDDFFSMDEELDAAAPDAEEESASLGFDDAEELTADSFFSMDEETDTSAPEAEETTALHLDDADMLEADKLFGAEETPAEPSDAGEIASLSLDDVEELTADSLFDDEEAPRTKQAEAEESASLSLDDAADMLGAESLFGEEEAPEADAEDAALPESADEGLDNFFSMEDDADTSAPEAEAEEPASLSLDDADDMLGAESLFGEEDAPEEADAAAALPETEDEGLDDFFSTEDDADTSAPEAEAEESASLSLDDAEELAEDSFFGEEPAQEGIDQEQASEIKEKLDSLFSFDNDALSDEEVPQGDLENEFIMPPADDGQELDQESQTAEEDVFADFPVQQDDESAEEMTDAFNGLDTDAEEDNVFAIAQGGNAASSLFAEASELDSPLDEQEDESIEDDADIPALEEDAFASIQDEPLAEEDDIFALAQQEAADEDFLNALKEREETADREEVSALQSKSDEELVLGKEYEEPEGLFSQFAQDAVPDAFEKSEDAGAESPEQAVEAASAFSALALAAAALTAAPSAHNLQQVSELAAAARQEKAVPPNKTILLHLLDSSSAMLAKAPGGRAADSGAALVQELAAGLDASDEPGKLPEIISRYTAWQQDFFDQLVTDGPRPASSPDPGLQQLQGEVAQLKQELISEIRLLRQELGKG